MKRALLERNIALFLFVAVLIAFSYAEEESKKIRKLYTKSAPAKESRIALKSTSTTQLPK